MSDINWKYGAVCYFAKKQWFPNNGALGRMLKGDIHHYNYGDFQLNEITTGDFIPASELDTEQKYNDVVEVFGLFGHESDSQSGYDGLARGAFARLTIRKTGFSNVKLNFDCKRQLTYHQIIAIGKLKRMMLERERSGGGYINEIPIPDNTSEFDAIVSSKSVGIGDYFSDRVGTAKALNIEINGKPVKPKRRNKSKQAYDILKSLDYEYDLVKQRWYKKEFI